MQPSGEQPNRPTSGRPPLSRQRSTDGVNPPIQRRPLQPMARRTYAGSLPTHQPQDQPDTSIQAPADSQPPQVVQTPEQEPAQLQPPYSPTNDSIASPEPEPIATMPIATSPPSPELQPPAPQQPTTEPSTEQHPAPFQTPNNMPAQAPAPHIPIAPINSTGSETPKPHSFTPPPQKKRRRIFTIIAITGASLLIIAGIISFAKAQAAWNNPDKAMKDAIGNNLTLKKVKSQTTSQSINSTTEYDFTAIKNPIISTESTIPQPKGPINMTGYGSAKNNFFSYTKLPSNLNSQGVKNAIGAVVQSRANGIEYKGVEGMPKKVSDPRYQVISPLLFGNYDEKTRTQLTDFMLNNKVYKYDINKVVGEKINDEGVLAYPIKLNVSYLKVSNQSAVFNMGFDPAEVQLGIDNLQELEGAKITIYIRKSDHKFIRIKIEKDGQTKTVDYTNQDDLSIPDEPQTKLTWPNFEPVQAQIDAQTTLTTTKY